MTESQLGQLKDNRDFPDLGIEEKKGLPWWLIIVGCFIFPPFGYFVALAAAFHKLFREKYYLVRNGKWAAGFGWGVFLFGLLFVFLFLFDETFSSEPSAVLAIIIMALFFCLPGLFLIFQGRKCRKTGEYLLLYYPMITQSPTKECSLDDVAVKCNESYETVCSQIERLIKAGLLKDSYINQQTHCLVSPLAGSRMEYVKNQAASHRQTQSSKVTQKTVVACKCPSCGGVNNVREGESQPCEYCGTVLTCEKSKQDESSNTEKVFQDVNEMMGKMSDMMGEMFK